MARRKIPDAVADNILAVVRNQSNAAEGPLLPPPQKGVSRVPLVTQFRVLQTQSFVGGTQFTLGFLEPDTNQQYIDHYNIYVAGISGNLNAIGSPTTAQHSPAIIRVATTSSQRVVFYAQTALKSGMVSPLSVSPTCTGTTIAGQISSSDIPAGSITVAQLADETPGSLITFGSGAGVAQLITPVASGSLLASAGSTVPPTYQTFSALNLVLGNTNLGTAGGVVFVASSGTVTEDDTKFHWDDTNFRLGIGTNTPGVSLQVVDNNDKGGIRVEGTTNPAIILSGSGTIRGYIGIPTASAQYTPDTALGDIVNRVQAGNLFETVDSGTSSRRMVRPFKALANNTATTIFSLAVTTNTSILIRLSVASECTNGTDMQVNYNEYAISAYNKAGTITAAIVENTTIRVTAASSGTFVTTLTASNANPSVIQLNLNSSLAGISANYPRATITIENFTRQALGPA